MEISVIVPSLNEEKFIEPCLKSISKQNFPRNKYEIIVSDGGSTDHTIKIAKKYADNIVVTKKKGIWWGRNYGAKFARGKYLVFIDADTTIESDYLQTAKRYFKRGYIGLSMGYHLDSNDFRTQIIENLGNLYWIIYSSLTKIYLLGFNLCVSRTSFEEIGGFKNRLIEDGHMSKELISLGKVAFLKHRKATTSRRRFDRYGVLGVCRYYLELALLDNLILRRKFGKAIKNNSYTMVR